MGICYCPPGYSNCATCREERSRPQTESKPAHRGSTAPGAEFIRGAGWIESAKEAVDRVNKAIRENRILRQRGSTVADAQRDTCNLRTPDWEDLLQRYCFDNLNRQCSCHLHPPCGWCVDGWQEDIDWDHEREVNGYARELGK